MSLYYFHDQNPKYLHKVVVDPPLLRQPKSSGWGLWVLEPTHFEAIHCMRLPPRNTVSPRSSSRDARTRVPLFQQSILVGEPSQPKKETVKETAPIDTLPPAFRAASLEREAGALRLTPGRARSRHVARAYGMSRAMT